jgi:hypothetical protein
MTFQRSNVQRLSLVRVRFRDNDVEALNKTLLFFPYGLYAWNDYVVYDASHSNNNGTMTDDDTIGRVIATSLLSLGDIDQHDKLYDDGVKTIAYTFTNYHNSNRNGSTRSHRINDSLFWNVQIDIGYDPFTISRQPHRYPPSGANRIESIFTISLISLSSKFLL